MKTLLSILIISIFIILSCEEFTKYNLEGSSPEVLIRINGVISDYYSGEPVKDAEVQIGPRATLTNINGQFRLHFPLGTDENRDKPVPIIIHAYNYETYFEEKVIYPEDTEINFDLVYAAPIISDVEITNDGKGNYICRAKITDYQNASSIVNVQMSFRYALGTWSDWRHFVMQFVQGIDQFSSYFEGKAPVHLEGGAYFNGRFEIKAWDRDGHEGYTFGDY